MQESHSRGIRNRGRVTSTGGNPAPLKRTYVRQAKLSSMRWIRLINFFPRFVRDVHISRSKLSSLARERASLCMIEGVRGTGSQRGSLSFSSASGKRVRDEALRDSEYVRESYPSATSLIAHPCTARRRPPSRCPACPEMTNVTCHGHKGKLSSTTRHGNRVALAGHAVATREEKSGRFISQKGARQDLCRLSPTDALAVSPRWHRTAAAYDNKR